jgi:hypothetical protein
MYFVVGNAGDRVVIEPRLFKRCGTGGLDLVERGPLGDQSISIGEFKFVPSAFILVPMGSPINRSVIIDGQTILRRGFTAWAWVYFVAFVAAPFLGAAAFIDYLLYLTIIR